MLCVCGCVYCELCFVCCLCVMLVCCWCVVDDFMVVEMWMFWENDVDMFVMLLKIFGCVVSKCFVMLIFGLLSMLNVELV